MKESYHFREATPLLNFINENKEKLAGQRIRAYYCDGVFCGLVDGPVVFELDDYCVILRYHFYSDLKLYVCDNELLKSDLSLRFLYSEDKIQPRWLTPLRSVDFPYVGKEIIAVGIKCFSEEFEINPSSGKTRPEGGDYFSKITVYLEDGNEFYICAAPPILDGYIDVWD